MTQILNEGTAFEVAVGGFRLDDSDPSLISGDVAFMSGGVAQRATDGKDEWLTPPSLKAGLGEFDLDPCAPVASRRPWPTAKRHFTIEDNGLRKEWNGCVWLNPPYGNETRRWMMRLAEHGDGIALIFARTETATFFDAVWPRANAILFLKGRITFFNSDGTPAAHTAAAPSCLIAYGKRNVLALENCGLEAHLVQLR